MTPLVRERFVCSDAARLRGDDNAATATRLDAWMLIEVPGPWGRAPLHDAGLPLAVQETLIRATETLPRSRVVFIRRRFETRVGCRIYIVRSEPARLLQLDLPSIDDVAHVPFTKLVNDEQAESIRVAGGIEVNVIHSTTPLVLVCTHGQRDSCCGRRGFPLYDALRHRPELDVWQCSHIGGDRFAANAVVLPWGLYYGPVEPRDADALCDAILSEEILIPAYRGRSSMPRLAQAAETFVRRATGLTGRDALQVEERSTSGNLTHVRLRDQAGTAHHVTIEQYTSTDSARLTCTAEDACPVVQFRLTEYRAVLG